MNYCSSCGSPVSLKVPDGDDRERHVCDACEAIHYSNPKMIAGAIPEWEGRVLLCRRAIEPRHGLWTLPAGFLENGETIPEGAAREAREEANASLVMGDLFTLFSIPHIDQIYALYRSTLETPEFSPGYESLEVALFEEDRIPWDEIAFPAIHKTLELYFEDRGKGRYRIHTGTILRAPGRRYRPVFRVRSV